MSSSSCTPMSDLDRRCCGESLVDVLCDAVAAAAAVAAALKSGMLDSEARMGCAEGRAELVASGAGQARTTQAQDGVCGG